MKRNMLLLVVGLSFQIFAGTAGAQGKAKAFLVLNPAGDFVAEMSNVKGGAVVSGDKVVAKGVVIDLTTLKTGLELRDNHAKDKYLEVKKFPTAEIIEAVGQGGKGKAKLKFHGKEGTVDGTYKMNGKFVDVEFVLKLSEFGISEINYKGIGVEDEVKLQASIPVLAAAATAPPAGTAAPAAGKAPVKATKPLKK